MGVWGAIKHAAHEVADFVEGAAGSIEDVVHKAAEKAAEAAETAGHWVEDRANDLAGYVRKIPGVGELLGAVISWAGRVLNAAFVVLGSVAKLIGGIIAGVVGGVLRVFAGILVGSWAKIAEGLLHIVSGILGGVLYLIFTLFELASTTILFFLDPERRLTADETALLHRVFHKAIDLGNVRIKEGQGPWSFASAPFTIGNTIYLNGHPSEIEPEVFVHEATHVWQYQNQGADYITGSIGGRFFVPDNYSWERELSRGHMTWQTFNVEAEADFLEDIYIIGRLHIAGSRTLFGNGCFFDADGKSKVGEFKIQNTDNSGNVSYTDYTDLANDSVSRVRLEQTTFAIV